MEKLYLLSLLLIYIAITRSQKCSRYYEPDLEDCSKYEKCNQTSNITQSHFCPFGQFFNPSIQNCDNPSNVKCPSKLQV